MIARSQGDDGYILIDGGTENYRYLYGINCYRIGTDWFEGSSGNGGGWSACSDDDTVGTHSVWDDAPTGADMVCVSLGDEVREEPIVSGTFLVVWWRQACEPMPWVEAYRIDGEWTSGWPSWARLLPPLDARLPGDESGG